MGLKSRYFEFISLFSILVIVLSSCAPSKTEASKKQSLMIYAAMSLSDALQEFGGEFEKKTGISIEYNFAGTNVLATQIAAGAQADIIFSANMHWANWLKEKGLLAEEALTPLLSNELVMITHPKNTLEWNGAQSALGWNYKFLALGDPDAVPAGQYAKAWLKDICDPPLWGSWKHQVLPAPNVRAVLAYVASDPGIIGIVYESDFMMSQESFRMIYRIPVDDSLPIHYTAAPLIKSNKHALAHQYLSMIQSKFGMAIFTEHGFSVIEK